MPLTGVFLVFVSRPKAQLVFVKFQTQGQKIFFLSGFFLLPLGKFYVQGR